MTNPQIEAIRERYERECGENGVMLSWKGRGIGVLLQALAEKDRRITELEGEVVRLEEENLFLERVSLEGPH